MRKSPILPVLALSFLAVLSSGPASAQSSGAARWVDNEGCWCGFQTGIVRSYVVRGVQSTAAHKQAAADVLEEWNRFAKLFNVSIDGSSSLGSAGNGVNEVNVFISSSDSVARYGIELEPSIFGVAVSQPSGNFGDFNQCREFDPAGCAGFTETDVVVNAGFPTGWTGDWFAPGNDARGGAATVQATVLHEVGHTLGLHHIFDIPQGAGFGNSLSTMNYLNDDVGKFVSRIDAKTLRTEYPAAARSFVDVAIYPYVYANDKYKQTYTALSKTSVLPDEALTVGPWLVQSIGSQKAGPFRITFYIFPAGSRPYPQPTDVAIGNVDFSSADADAEAALNDTPLKVPAGTPAGNYWVGAIVTVGGAEDVPWVAGKPNNNRFIVGHDAERIVLRVLQGASGSVAADFRFAPTSPQAGQAVTFEDLSRGSPTAWSWSFGDAASGGSNTSTQRNPEHTFSQPGTYTVSLLASAGSSSNSVTRSVVVVPKPGSGSSTAAQVVAVVIDLPGRFSSELTLSNAGTTTATVRLRYTASPVFGGQGSGTVSETLSPGRQLVVANAIEYLRGKGLGIPLNSNQGGSLRVEFEGLSNGGAGYASARTTAPVPGVGRAGLSYPAVDSTKVYSEPVAIFGLRQNSEDRSNVALVNAGTSGNAVLKMTVVNADGKSAVAFDPVTLAPGEWNQYNGILDQTGEGWTEGWVIVEPLPGSAPFLAYGVFNNNGTNDGSYVSAVPDSLVDAFLGVPVIVEVGDRFSSELMLTNLSDKKAQAYFEFVEALAHPGGASTGVFYVDLDPFEQAIVPDIVDALRRAGAPIGPKGAGYAGSLSVLFSADNNLTPGLAGVRTSSPSTTGPGSYGLFYAGESYDGSARDAWLYGLQQNSSTRSNLAIVNSGVTNTPITVRVEVYDGNTGGLKSRQSIGPLQPYEWRQINNVLAELAPGTSNGYARITVISGDGTFQAYAVVNDGAAPGVATDDGSYVSMVVSQ